MFINFNNFFQYFNDELFFIKISIIIFILISILFVKLIQYLTFSQNIKEIQKSDDSDNKTIQVIKKEYNFPSTQRRSRSFGLTHDELMFELSDEKQIREIEKEDFDKGVLELLNQLSNNPDLTKMKKEQFNEYIDKLYMTDDTSCRQKIFVIIDKSLNKIIATGSVIFEQKLLHMMGKVSHIEDIVVSKNSRGKGLGKKFIDYLTRISKDEGCYKVILNCCENKKVFYEKCGYSQKGIYIWVYILENINLL